MRKCCALGAFVALYLPTQVHVCCNVRVTDVPVGVLQSNKN